MKDDGLWMALGAVAVVAGAGLVRRGSAAWWKSRIRATRGGVEVAEAEVFVSAPSEWEAEEAAFAAAQMKDDWDWQADYDDGYAISVQDVERAERRSLRDLERG